MGARDNGDKRQGGKGCEGCEGCEEHVSGLGRLI